MEEKKKEIFEKVKDVLVEQLGVNQEDVTENSKIIEDLGADSLDVVDIVQVLEEKFSTKIPNEKIEELKTVQDIIEYIAENV